MNEELKLFLAQQLMRENIGSVKIFELYEKWCNGFVKPNIDVDFSKFLSENHINIITCWERRYPWKLVKLKRNMPAILFGRGDINLLRKDSNRRLVAIVGARNIDKYSISVIDELFGWSGEAAKKLIYISGLAYGVDAKVHDLALKCDIKTIAVVAGGIMNGFPVGNQNLYNGIVKKGLVISEFPRRERIFKGMFPMRNRIIAALADIVIIVQAAEDSGALSTAMWAQKLGQEVYIVPGDVLSKKYKGGNELIAQGFKTLVNREQFAKLAELSKTDCAENHFINISNKERLILEYISSKRQKCKLSDLTKNAVSTGKLKGNEIGALLTKLELQGILRLLRDGSYVLVEH